jgi:hypothetical protein
METPRKSTVYVFGETRVSKAAPGGVTLPPRYAYRCAWVRQTLVGPPVPIRLPIPSDLMPEVGSLPPWRPQLPWLSDEIYPQPDGEDPDDYECELCEPTGRW